MAESDDLIIDLTDLMEEEVSEKETTANVSDDKPLKLETDTFDLGKELTLDDSPVNTSDDKFDFDKVFKESLNGIASVINPEPKPEQPPEMQSEEMPFLLCKIFPDTFFSSIFNGLNKIIYLIINFT